jgi:23S rRNA (adenine1618-N6)-methyltransferase
VLELNRSLLKFYYQVTDWFIPDGYLCPPVPGRADYVHHLADLLMSNGMKRKDFSTVSVLDVGTGANVIYPIIGTSEYQWSFTVSDISEDSLRNVVLLQQKNQILAGLTIKKQNDPTHVFTGCIGKDDFFDLTMCNPPFHSSEAEAMKGTSRKTKNLAKKAKSNRELAPSLNFGGRSNELWCDGGEHAFIRRMIFESEKFANQVGWFTCLISKKDNLSPLRRLLKKTKATQIKTVTMQQGQKVSRFLAWTYQKNSQKV